MGQLYFPKPIRIPDIIISDPMDFPAYHFLGYILHFFGRHSRVNTSWFTNCILQYHGTCCNYAIAMNSCVIHHNGSHSDQYIIMNCTTMHDGVVTYRDIITNSSAVLLKRAMDACTILDIYLVAHSDKINITPDHTIKLGTAVITHNHITHNCCIRRQEAIVTKLGQFIFYRKNQGHIPENVFMNKPGSMNQLPLQISRKTLPALANLCVLCVKNRWIPVNYFFIMLPRLLIHH